MKNQAPSGAVRAPARKLYISDLHFFHENLNHRMDRRGFANYEEMNNYMIGKWNEKVTDRDEVYVLGDFSVSKGKTTNRILGLLNGKKYLIEGNHDEFLKDRQFDRSLFGWIRPYAEINDNRRRVILSHYPVFCYNGQYRKRKDAPFVYMLYGHVLVDSFIKQTRNSSVMLAHATEPASVPCQMINCFCMFSDYTPLTLDEWIENDRVRREQIQPPGDISR